MILFIHEENKLSKAAGERLLRKALGIYCSEKKTDIIDTIQSVEILRTDKGKPYFKDISVNFSVSHSGSMWMCLMSDTPVGLDLQEEREVKAHELAERFFTCEEAEYIDLHGTEAFFDLWVRKEAYVKYLGTGISEGLSSFSVLKDGKPADMIKGLFLIEIEVGAGIKCTICSEKMESVWIVEIE